jgi:hypothetical protein
MYCIILSTGENSLEVVNIKKRTQEHSQNLVVDYLHVFLFFPNYSTPVSAARLAMSFQKQKATSFCACHRKTDLTVPPLASLDGI